MDPLRDSRLNLSPHSAGLASMAVDTSRNVVLPEHLGGVDLMKSLLASPSPRINNQLVAQVFNSYIGPGLFNQSGNVDFNLLRGALTLLKKDFDLSSFESRRPASNSEKLKLRENVLDALNRDVFSDHGFYVSTKCFPRAIHRKVYVEIEDGVKEPIYFHRPLSPRDNAQDSLLIVS